MFDKFSRKGKASFILGGQFGSEGKGSCAAAVAVNLAKRNEHFDVVTCNSGAQAGHTSTHEGVTRVTFNLPTASLFPNANGLYPITYLNAGAIIDPDRLMQELDENPQVTDQFFIHPNAAVITEECRAAENRDDSAQTKIASTRKGVGEALARKVLRSGTIAKDHPKLGMFARRWDLNYMLGSGMSVLVEIPQGFSLSVDSHFYPHTTSRNCTIMQGMSDAGIHPDFVGDSMLVLRTFPIRVGNIDKPVRYDETHGIHVSASLLGYSGDGYPDQRETSWEKLGRKPEITTVTKRVRRVFEFSWQQAEEALRATRPRFVYLTFCDYMDKHSVSYMVTELHRVAAGIGIDIEVYTQWGPTTDDVREA